MTRPESATWTMIVAPCSWSLLIACSPVTLPGFGTSTPTWMPLASHTTTPPTRSLPGAYANRSPPVSVATTPSHERDVAASET